MRVFAGGVSTETNTFSPIPTALADFDVIRVADFERNGFNPNSALDAIHKRTLARGWDFRFGLSSFAQPAGNTVRSAYESMRDELLDRLRESMPVDMVLLPLHGAMVADGYDDCEADLTQHVREIVGPDVPIGVELDLHCHLSQDLLDAADVVVIYKEYPHTDMADRAGDLFDLIADTAEGKIKPTMALFDCRMISLYKTPFEPVRTFVDDMLAAEKRGDALSLSLAHGFPWGDVPDFGCRMLAVTDNDPAGAERLAREWGMRFHDMRREVTHKALSMKEALDLAFAAPVGPVVVADQSDNPGGGAPSDSTFVLAELLARGAEGVALGLMWDPIVVRVASGAGEGARLSLRLGGKMGPMSGDPLDIEALVLKVEPRLQQVLPQIEGDLVFECGAAVLLRIGGVDVVVNDKRIQMYGPTAFTNMGVDVSSKRVLIPKSTQHFYAGFAPLASQVLYMGAPGAVAPIMTEIPLVRADLNKYPWVESPFES